MTVVKRGYLTAIPASVAPAGSETDPNSVSWPPLTVNSPTASDTTLVDIQGVTVGAEPGIDGADSSLVAHCGGAQQRQRSLGGD